MSVALRVLLSTLLVRSVVASNSSTDVTTYVTYVDDEGNEIYLADNRKPALYTDQFAQCMDSSVMNLTRFDAAYYKDNMTVLFHLEGSTSLWNESLMMFIGVYAYGESRFDLTFNPCSANIASLCPANANVSIEADGIIPVAPSDVANIPPIALSIPDFEGQAILRIFSNSSQSEIACYTAVVTNGNSFSQPATVGTALFLFTLVAIVASFATAIYGDHIPTMRTHYAHSLSVGVVFAVFQHIYFTGALSVNWPSILVAWWSNFAWAAGMIHTTGMQASINAFVGNNVGNTSMALQRRELANSSSGYFWYGDYVGAGMPLPGNYSGFAGTLAQSSIRASNAFLTGFCWLLIILLMIGSGVTAFKWGIELTAKLGWARRSYLPLFRKHWVSYGIATILRSCSIAFFSIMFLCMFDFYYQDSAGPKAIATLAFIVFFFGTIAIVAYAYYYRVQSAGYAAKRAQKPYSIHEDEDYLRRFGWLTARFRRSRWWFFGAWFFYEFIRACFYAGAANHALTQVFGLLVVEIVSFGLLIWIRPFEGQRLNALVVYMLGFSKVTSVALSAAFDVTFNLPRIITTVIGMIIVVIQGLLTIVTLNAVVVGAISSYMSISRNKETHEFKPEKWRKYREDYFDHLNRAAHELPPPVKEKPESPPQLPHGPYFSVSSVRRVNKIQDYDPTIGGMMRMDPALSVLSLQPPSRVMSPTAPSQAGVCTTAKTIDPSAWWT
ncbi:hypothetical protein ANO11243_013040 [Dothideomycetidae sp. 11243]|nr:hypothetical protein ANO11243_013040 [fungal sp. No.11243]